MKKRTRNIIIAVVALIVVSQVADKLGWLDASDSSTTEESVGDETKLQEEAAIIVGRQLMRQEIANDPAASLERGEHVVPGPEKQEYIVSGKIKTKNAMGREIYVPWHADMKLVYSDKMKEPSGWEVISYGITE